MKALLAKLAIALASNGNNRKRAWILALSIISGFLALMFLPVAVLYSVGQVGSAAASELDISITQEDIISRFSSEQQAEIDSMEQIGEQIETAMAEAEVRRQTRKAQIIYAACLSEIGGFNAESYARLFATAPNDEDLINAIASTYGVSIDYEQYLRSYTWIMNLSIDPYLFDDETAKTAADLAHWAENAYVSGWGYKEDFFGEQNTEDRIRYCDNTGLIFGYLNYDPSTKEFGNACSTLTFTEQGDISTMPDIAGIGVYDGIRHGIYVGSGEVIYSTDNPGYVTKEAVSNGAWTSWCTYGGIDYPQEVQDAIDSISAADDSSEESSDSSSEQK